MAMAVAISVSTPPALASGTTGATSNPLLMAANQTRYVSDPASLVNPFIGTDANGHTYPGAVSPFGMVQWSPDTPSRPPGGGYSYSDNAIIGYSLTHLSGVGCPSAGDIPILPTTGVLGPSPATMTEPFSHLGEVATPGYYQVTAGDVTTQLTTTTRSGVGLFSFPAGSGTGNLLFKMSDSAGAVTGETFQVINNKEVAGSVTTGGFCHASNSYTVYFDMAFDRPFNVSGGWTQGGTGDYVSFPTTTNLTVRAEVGLSYVSTANAAQNREVEDGNSSLNTLRQAAHKSWNAVLDRIEIAGGTSTQQAVFYTAMYHSLLNPNVFSDVNGQYIGFDGQVHQLSVGQGAQYANYSGWDIYRSEVPLEAILAPGQTDDIVTSMLNDYAQSGQLPKWSENNSETYSTIGDPSDAIIADAYAFGATAFDALTALTDMESEANNPGPVRPGLSYYEQDGYIPADAAPNTCIGCRGPVSTQLDYNVDDYAIAELAQALGQPSTPFVARAQNWQNVFNPATGFMQGRQEAGQFTPSFVPTSGKGFFEGDAYAYTAFVPFDLAGLIAAEGGPQKWISYLNQMTSSVTSMGPTQIQMGNEPSFNIPWEYDYAGAPYQTQQVVREIQDSLFSDNPEGLPGNDDLGSMSSWYVFSALGAYPETPGSATLALGSPLFTRTAIHLVNGTTIVEEAPTAADNAPYVQAMSINRKAWTNAYLPVTLFSNGGTINWTLSTSPNTNWATSSSARPPSDTDSLDPALGYLANATNNTTVDSGSQDALVVGVMNTTGLAQSVTWTATTPVGSGLIVEPASDTITVGAEDQSSEPVTVEVPSATPVGHYHVIFQMQTASHMALPAVIAAITVKAAPAGSG